MSFTYWYVATPYTKYPAGLEAAHVMSARLTAVLMKLDLPVYSPIAHTHSIAVHGDMDKVDHDLWVRCDQPLLDAASGLIVIQAETWEISRGIAHEIRVMEKAGKPIVYWDPATTFPIDAARAVMQSRSRMPIKIASNQRQLSIANEFLAQFPPRPENWDVV